MLDRFMRPLGLLCLTGAVALVLAGASSFTGAGGSEAAGAGLAPPAPYIVVYHRSVDDPAAATAQRGRSLGFAPGLHYGHAIKGFAARLSAGQVARLKADPSVALVTPDRPVRSLGTVPLAPGESAPSGVRRVAATADGQTRAAASSSVAVIDTGIDLAHPDLNVAAGKNCVSPGTPAQDDNGHGTHVAGTIGALNSGSGVVGVAPGTSLYAVKVLDSAGSGSYSSVICGIDWVTANAAALHIKVANLSLGGPGTDDGNCGNTNGDPLHQAVCRLTAAGVTPVVAAGNGDSAGVGIDFATQSPADYPEALTVTAVADGDGRPGAAGGTPTCDTSESDDRSATFSNFAVRGADIAHSIAAPGVCILSTWLGGRYAVESGTSMATPHVAAAAALCEGDASGPGPCAGLTPAQTITRLRADAAAHAQSDPSFGFCGDPDHPAAAGYYGNLIWEGAASSSSSTLVCGAAAPAPTPAQPAPVAPEPPLTLAPEPAPAPAPTPAPAPGALLLRLGAPATQRVRTHRSVTLRALCTRACTLEADGRITVAGKRYAVRVSGSRSVPAGTTVTVRGLLSRTALRVVKRQLLRSRTTAVKVVLSGTGGTDTATAVRRFRLRR